MSDTQFLPRPGTWLVPAPVGSAQPLVRIRQGPRLTIHLHSRTGPLAIFVIEDPVLAVAGQKGFAGNFPDKALEPCAFHEELPVCLFCPKCLDSSLVGLQVTRMPEPLHG